MRKQIRNNLALFFMAFVLVSCDSMVAGHESNEFEETGNTTVSEPVIDRIELNQYGFEQASDINDQGDIVGGNFFWNHSNNHLHHLNFTGRALNNSGQVVGDLKGSAYYWDVNSGKSPINHPYSYYEVVDEWIVPYDINNEGRVVGEAWIVDRVNLDEPGEFAYLETEEAFGWSFGNSEYEMIEHYGRANGINDSRLIVGTHPMGAFKWDSDNYMRFLNSSGDYFNEAYAVNYQGQIVGSILKTNKGKLSGIKQEVKSVQRILESDGRFDTFHLLNLSKQSVSVHKGVRNGDFDSFSPERMYNESLLNVWNAEQQQEMLQNVLNSVSGTVAYLWDDENGDQEIGTLGGDWSTAFDINDHGQVVGYSDIGNGEYRAFYWDRENGMIELPSNGKNSIARAINNHGQIVGENNGAVMWEVTLPNSNASLASRNQ